MDNQKIKTAVIYYSSTGANYQFSRWAVQAATEAGSETRLRKVAELAPASAIEHNPYWKKNASATEDVETASLSDLEWADVIVFSVPTRFGNVAAQMKQFLDSAGPLWVEGKLANKVVTGMSSAENLHGGQEATILNLYTTMYHWGAIVVAPGYTSKASSEAGGNPYGTSASVSKKGEIQENVKDAIFHQVKRAVMVGLWIKKGSHNYESVSDEIAKHLEEAQ